VFRERGDDAVRGLGADRLGEPLVVVDAELGELVEDRLDDREVLLFGVEDEGRRDPQEGRLGGGRNPGVAR
jgi:hypothetical protein